MEGIPIILYHGNITTAFQDKRTVQTIAGAYPGSILKGVDVHRDPEPTVHDSFQAPNHDVAEQHSMKSHAAPSKATPVDTATATRSGPSGFLLACVLLLGAAAMVFRKRKYQQQRDEMTVDYEPVVQIEFGDTSYVEMASPSET